MDATYKGVGGWEEVGRVEGRAGGLTMLSDTGLLSISIYSYVQYNC